MLIKYMGDKEEKRLMFHTKDWGLMEFVFNPTCKVTDSDVAKFLLSPDRKGLFVTVDEKPGEPVHEAKKLEEPIKVPLPDQKPIKKIRVKKQQKKLGDNNVSDIR